MLLREQRHEIHLAVVIQIDGNDVNAARPRIDGVVGEGRLRGCRRSILENRDPAGLAPPECRDREVVLAIAVEIR